MRIKNQVFYSHNELLPIEHLPWKFLLRPQNNLSNKIEENSYSIKKIIQLIVLNATRSWL